MEVPSTRRRGRREDSGDGKHAGEEEERGGKQEREGKAKRKYLALVQTGPKMFMCRRLTFGGNAMRCSVHVHVGAAGLKFLIQAPWPLVPALRQPDNGPVPCPKCERQKLKSCSFLDCVLLHLDDVGNVICEIQHTKSSARIARGCCRIRGASRNLIARSR
jgi:hypothetical protein